MMRADPLFAPVADNDPLTVRGWRKVNALRAPFLPRCRLCRASRRESVRVVVCRCHFFALGLDARPRQGKY